MATAQMLILLTINPGSTSTKVALFQASRSDEPRLRWSETVSHSAAQLAQFARVADQFAMRYADISELLRAQGTELTDLSLIVGRGGLFRRRMGGGTYNVTPLMLEEMRAGDPTGQREHASNLGILLASRFAEGAGQAQGHAIPAYTVDPPPVDEMQEVARITGWPEITRYTLSHALSAKAAGRRAGRDLGKPYAELNLVITHLGGGISVTAHRQGLMIDQNQALDGDGPFSPERSGGLPVGDLARICYSSAYSYAEVKKKFAGRGGLVAHLGTNDAREVERRIAVGDEHAELIYRALAYNVAKEVGKQAVALSQRPDALVFTGALAHSAMLLGWLKEQLDWLAPILVYPGSDEMQALADGGWRVYTGQEQAREYPSE